MLKANPKTSWNSTECIPVVPGSSYVDDSATLIGDVRIGEQVYVAPCVSLRADEAHPIIIGDECNIQEWCRLSRPTAAPSSSEERSPSPTAR